MKLHIAISRCKKFREDEDGALLGFALVMFIIILVGSGMAVDFMRQEAARADLQNALDRGLLAATSLSQTVIVDENGDNDLEAEYTAFIDRFIDSRAYRSVQIEPVVDPNITDDGRSKEVTATASYDLDTFFLKIVGIDTLPVFAVGGAVHARNEVEVSLVLDVSGSMEDNNVTVDGVTRTRLEQLKIDAKGFITYMLDQDKDDAGNPLDKTTFNLIPYSAQVRLSDNLTNQFAAIEPFHDATEIHSYYMCFDFDVDDFKSVEMTPTTPFRQFPAFRDGSGSSGSRDGCPAASNEIVVANANETQLHDAIDAMTREGWTAIYNGVKWGAGLLDPAAQPIIDGLIAAGDVEAKFDDLPRNYAPEEDDDVTNIVKALVVMSDGRNTNLPTMRPDDYNGTPENPRGADYWHDRNPSQNYSDCSRSNSNPSYSKFANECSVSTGSREAFFGVSTSDLSDTTLVQYDDGSAVTEPDAVLYEICDRARAKGIVIYAIAFELSAGSRGARALENCARVESRFFAVNALDLEAAFKAIAADIQNLKLTN